VKKASNTATDFMPKEKGEFSVNSQNYDMRTNKNQGMFSSFEPTERRKKDKTDGANSNDNNTSDKKMTFAKSFKSMSELTKDIANVSKNQNFLKREIKSDKNKMSPAEIKAKNNDM
jgi:hypothetical protein